MPKISALSSGSGAGQDTGDVGELLDDGVDLLLVPPPNEDDQKHINALVVHHPQQRAVDGESEDGGHRHHRQLTVLTRRFAVPPGHRGSFHRSAGLNVAVPCCPDASILVFLLLTRVLT